MLPTTRPTRLVIDALIPISNNNNDDDDGDGDDTDTRWTRYLCGDRSDCLYSARTEPIDPYDCNSDW
jgi:hypothetical protein